MSNGVDRRHRRTSGTSGGARPPASLVRPAAHGDVGSALDRLADLLDTPQLARVVPHLPAEALHQLVRHQGVEGSAPLLAAATPDQLRSVLDLDLWRSAAPGFDEAFDRVRFGEWVEGLVDSGDEFAATIVSRIDRQVVIAGLAAHIRVFDPATLTSAWSGGDDEAGETAGFAGLSCDVGGYAIRARRDDGWDAIVALLNALDAHHGEVFREVMQGCRRLSHSRPEADGLDALLLASDQAMYEVGSDRHARRSERGYLSPADARAFLQMSRQPFDPAVAPPPMNPIAAACLAAYDGGEPEPAGAEPTGDAAPEPPGPVDADVREVVDAVAVLLAEAAIETRPRALLAAPSSAASSHSDVRALLEHLRVADERSFMARGQELAFLANALMAGCSLHAKPFTVEDASEAVMATCSLGLDCWPGRWPEEAPTDRPRLGAAGAAPSGSFLSDHDLLTAFQVGWSALHQASLFVGERLAAVLRQVHTLDTKTHQGLVVLRRELEKHCAAGTPWGVRDALDVLAILDTVAWTGLLGALDECPVVPEALTAIMERRKGAISATAFAFVSSRDQVEAMRAFARKLGEFFAG
jgi:hypothetical protein